MDGHNSASPTRQRLLESALDLFAARGYDGVNVREIARAAGITEGSVYNHFKGKEAIREALFTEIVEKMKAMLPTTEFLEENLESIVVPVFLKRGLENFLAFLDQPANQEIWRFLNAEQYRDARARTLFLEVIIDVTLAFCEGFFAKMIEAGKIRPADPRLLAAEYQYPLFAMVSEYYLRKLDDKGAVRIREMMNDHVDFFCRSIETESE